MSPSRRTTLAFAALCLLSGSSWLLDEWRPSELDAPHQLFFDHLLAATVFAVLATSRSDWPGRRSIWLRLATVGALGLFILALPALLAPGSGVSSTTSALIFLFVPAVVVFAYSQGTQGFGPGRSPSALLISALAGLMGASLILPFFWPAEPSVQLHLLLLIASAIAAGLALVRLHRLMSALDRLPILPSLTFLCAFTALAASLLFLRGGHTAQWSGPALKLELLRCAAYSLPVLLLTGWLLRELRPPAFAARAFFTVVITLVESYAIFHPPLAWPTLLGTALLLVGGFGLFRRDSPEPSFTPARGAIDS